MDWARSTVDTRRPLILCEYSHAMGQAGGLAAYWAAFGHERGLQGGFVWEWADHSLRRREADGTTWLAHGGDVGGPDNDGTFVLDGLVSSDRQPHPLLAELAALTAPVVVERAGPAVLRITNRRWFTDIDDLVATWVLESDGRRVATGPMELPPIGPRSSADVADPSPSVAGTDILLTLTFRPRRRPPGHRPAGSPHAYNSSHPPTSPRQPTHRPGLHDPGTTAPEVPPSTKAPEVPPVDEGAGGATVDSDGIRLGGRSIAWPEVSLWRAPTDNDDPPGDWRFGPSVADAWRAAGLDRLEVVDRRWHRRRARAVRETDWASSTISVRHRQTATLTGAGVRIDERVDIDGDVVDLPASACRSASRTS